MFFVCSTGDVSRSIVALAVIGKFCITANFHALFVYTSEVYATPTRNTALSICSVFASAGGMAAPFVAQTASIHPTAFARDQRPADASNCDGERGHVDRRHLLEQSLLVLQASAKIWL